MSDLRKRTCIYYFRDFVKLWLLTGGLMLLLLAEHFVIYAGNPLMLKNSIRTCTSVCGLFIFLFNCIYALYGPAWNDSIVLSMGARRSDIFIGTTMRELVYPLSGLGVLYIICKLTGLENLFGLETLLISAAIGLSGLARIIGYKVKKYGKIVTMVSAVIAGCCGSLLATYWGGKSNWLDLSRTFFVGAFIGSLIIFVLLRFIIYRLNSKTAVR